MVVLMKRRAATGRFLILSGVLTCAIALPAPAQQATDRPEPDRVVEIVAERFLFTPSRITIEAGTTVELRLTSEDTDHGFLLVGPDDVDGDINIAIPKRNRGVASVFFAPTEPGDYRFECSRMCGAGHLYMSGVIRVTPTPSALAGKGGPR
jgi:heme/copper-type cytochrome/quinol oxidase subunit 2